MTVPSHGPARRELAALASQLGDDLPLDRGVALVAAEERAADVDALLAELDAIAASVVLRPGAPVVEHVARLHHRLFTELGFTGDADEYDAPRNSMLDRVLARRRGLPILLSIVYCEVARRCGLRVDPVGFPAHFVVAIADGDPRFFVDPFHDGQILTRDAMRERLQRMSRAPIDDATLDRHLRPSSGREVLVRVQHNLKRSFLYRDDLPGALRATERLLLLAPRPEEHRDRGLILHHLGRLDEAATDLHAYLAARPDARDAAEVRAALDDALAGRRPR